MVYIKKKDRPAAAVTDENQALLDRIEQLEREKAELVKTQIDSEPDDAMAYLKAQNAEMMKALASVVARGNGQPVDPGALKSRKNLPSGYGAPYVLTPDRKAQVQAIFAKFEGKGIEHKFDDASGSVTFRKKVKIRVYDKDNEVWVREEAWKSESVHCSSSDTTISKLIKFLLLV